MYILHLALKIVNIITDKLKLLFCHYNILEVYLLKIYKNVQM